MGQFDLEQPAMLQVMAARRTGLNLLPEPMMTRIHWRIYK